MVEGPDTSKIEDISVTKNEVPKRRGKEDRQPTKVVIRKLPGSMTEESFLEYISPLFEHDYFYYVQDENPSFGDHSYSRAYINFVNVEDVFTFTVKFDDYIFIDDNGQEYPAIVEYAPIQRIPKNRGNRKTDSFSNTIEDEPDYKEFLNQLETEEQEHKANAITEHYFDLTNDETQEKVTTTPLIEYLTVRKNEYIKFKEEKKEERRRRDLERRKLKEESRRVKKENKEAIKAKIMEKSKEEKKSNQDSKIFEEITSSSLRVRGKSYQEERQRDIARRKMEDKTPKTDDNKENNKTSEKLSDDGDQKETDKISRLDSKEEEFVRKNFEDKKYSEERKSGSYREKDDKKYTFGVKKREFIGGYDHDKHKSGKSYYYDDYKRGHSSYQKSTYAGGKYSKGKDYYEEKSSKRYDSKSKKYEYDYKDKKPRDKDFERKSTDQDLKLENKEKEKKEDMREDIEEMSRNYGKEMDDNSGSTSEIESGKSKDSKRDKNEGDPRAERRIKNKDRPAMQIYRPGMGKLSRQRLERNKSSDGKECD